MKPSDVREKTAAELKRLETELSEQLFHLRVKHATGRLEKTADLRQLRKDIARVKTIIREKGSGA
ncbi:MAG: 50S ribosomal protein L29 [Deltaproteobacteria bacterium]|nr:50S ribosomal protein L29 [Deltaproteobacteria bacterium]